jgi:polyhydroxyalkanoate synthase
VSWRPFESEPASVWSRVQDGGKAALPDPWRVPRPPGPLERIALDAQRPGRVDPELLQTLALPWGPLQTTRDVATAIIRAPYESPGKTRSVAHRLARLPVDAVSIVAGRSELQAAPGDRRFAAEAWQTNPAFRRLAQFYVAAERAVDEAIDAADLDWATERRVRLAAENVIAAIAPTNFLLTNPDALGRVVETRGRSIVTGLRHFVRDMASEPRLPRSVDTKQFTVGRNLAMTPGAVVMRAPMFELIQYAPATPRVRSVSLLVVGSMVNKYYVLDLAPGRSLIQHLVARGQTVFAISWRNPSPDDTDWSLDHYAQSVLSAMDAALDITSSEHLSVAGLCAGGQLVLGTAAAIAQRGEGHRVRTVTLSACAVDSAYPGGPDSMVTADTAPWLNIEAARRGYVEAHRIAGTFAWLRPNEGVWNSWVNNYLLGKPPRALDLLYWAADATNIPGALYRDMIRLSLENAFVSESEMRVLGTPLDLSTLTCDAYVVAAEHDHLTPWPGCYAATRALGGSSRFVLSTGGHISATVNPPGTGQGGFRVGSATGEPHDDWFSAAPHRDDSWWPDWTAWLARRSGRLVPAPDRLGNVRHPVLAAAPGVYVHERSG